MIKFRLFAVTFTLIMLRNSFTLGDFNNQNQNHFPENHQQPNLSEAIILFLGLHEVGKLSLMEIMAKQTLHRPSSSDLIEYSFDVPINEKIGRLKLVDIPGFGEPNSITQNAKVLTAVENYLKHPEGGNNKYPTIVLILSPFNDNRAEGVNSNFVKMLKGFEILKPKFGDYNNTSSNIIFVMTHFMSLPNSVTRRPNSRLEYFKNIVHNYTQFPKPIYSSVAETQPGIYNLEKDQAGNFKLPNKQLFPINIIDQIIQITMSRQDEIGEKIMRSGFSSNLGVPKIKQFSAFEPPGVNLRKLQNLLLSNGEPNEITMKLDNAYESLREDEKSGDLMIIKSVFQSLQIKSLDQIPRSEDKIIELVKQLPETPLTSKMLSRAFNIQIPILNISPLVGHGYDLLDDHILTFSPFKKSRKVMESSIGFLIPNSFICHLENESEDVFRTHVSLQDYFKERKQSLTGINPTDDLIKISQIQIRNGHNLISNENEETYLTAVKENRKFSLELNLKNVEFIEEFIEIVNNLSSFNSSIPESPVIWISFFRNYGTHVVRKAYGGGSIEVTAIGPKLHLNPDLLNRMKNHMFNYGLSGKNDSEVNSLTYFYNYIGGYVNTQMVNLTHIPKVDVTELIENWKKSLEYNPQMLETKLELIPISKLVAMLDKSKEKMIEESLNLYVQGKLVYIRTKIKNKPQKKIPTTTTIKPIIIATNPTVKLNTQSHNNYHYDSNGNENPITNNLTSNPSHCKPEVQILEKIIYIKENNHELVGHGHNLLYDITLPTSPFKPNSNSRIFLIENMKERTTSHFINVFSMSQYIEKRVNQIDPLFFVDPEHFKGEIKPGYYIENNNSLISQGISIAQEKLTNSKTLVNFTKFDFTQEFIKAVDSLPEEFYTQEEKLKYFQFIAKFGTHVVSFAYIGKFKHITYGGHTLNEIKDISCKATETSSGYGNNQVIELGHDIKMIRMSNVVEKLRIEIRTEMEKALRDYPFFNE